MRPGFSSWVVVLCLCGLLAACGAQAVGQASVAPLERDLLQTAAAQATAIIQQAQATALVLQARTQATALVQQAYAEAPATAAPTGNALPLHTPTPAGVADQDPIPPPTAEGTDVTAGASVTDTVELLGVGFAAEGGFIIASYKAPPTVAQTFWPGVLSITDEATGTVYNEVPLMPLVGPLIGRPVQDGQVGYFMLVHAPPILRPGSQVTVDLAGYTFEHVPVQ